MTIPCGRVEQRSLHFRRTKKSRIWMVCYNICTNNLWTHPKYLKIFSIVVIKAISSLLWRRLPRHGRKSLRQNDTIPWVPNPHTKYTWFALGLKISEGQSLSNSRTRSTSPSFVALYRTDIFFRRRTKAPLYTSNQTTPSVAGKNRISI